MTGEEELEKIVDVMISQPMEGLLYDLDLLPEQCGNDRMNMRRIVVKRQAIKIKELGEVVKRLRKIEIDYNEYISKVDRVLISRDKEMEQLRKEKEWLLNETINIYYTKSTRQAEKIRLIEKMQRVLKES